MTAEPNDPMIHKKNPTLKYRLVSDSVFIKDLLIRETGEQLKFCRGFG